jgi:hypothetical protein
MSAAAPAIGDTYRSNATSFLLGNGIHAGADFVVTNTDSDKVSLTLKYSNGKICPAKMTILKTLFGVNFTEDRAAPTNISYRASSHFYPDVDIRRPVLPSPLSRK